MRYIVFIEIPESNVEKYLEFWKEPTPENIKIIFPPQLLYKTGDNFSGLVVYKPKGFGAFFRYLGKFKSAGFKITISPIWENTEISKELRKFKEGKKKEELEWEKTSVKKIKIGSTTSLEILPLIDMKSDNPEMNTE